MQKALQKMLDITLLVTLMMTTILPHKLPEVDTAPGFHRWAHTTPTPVPGLSCRESSACDPAPGEPMPMCPSCEGDSNGGVDPSFCKCDGGEALVDIPGSCL